MKDFVEIGRLSKPYGINGQIKTVVEDEYLASLKATDFIFINQEGSLVPYFIEKLSENPHLLLKLEELERPEDIVPFSTSPIYLHSNKVIHDPNADNSLKIRYIGYTIFNLDKEEIGSVDKVEEFPQQLMASVILARDQTMVLIPLVESFIKDIDDDAQSITMDIPEGLLSL